MTIATRSIEHAVAEIEALDLSLVKFKLMHKEGGRGWTSVQADHCELEYKRFLMLLAKYPEEVISPNEDVDTFWHAHILDTKKYADDCSNIFGHFVHHFPYFGMRGESDASDLYAATKNTKRLYEQEFGKAVFAEGSYCGAVLAPSYCGATQVQNYKGVMQSKNVVDLHTRPTLTSM